MYAETSDRFHDPADHLHFSKTVYKKFSTFCRIKTLEDYLGSHPSQKILEKMLPKFNRRIDSVSPIKREALLQMIRDTQEEASLSDADCFATIHEQEAKCFEEALADHDPKAMQEIFFHCVHSGNLVLLKKIAASPVQIDLNAIEMRGLEVVPRTALTWAIATNNFELAHLLKDLGADVNVPDGLGQSPLRLALSKQMYL